jgi:hypothetical protein
MSTGVAIKRFTVEQGTIEGGHYQIIVKDGRNKIVDNFTCTTMIDAQDQFDARGYEEAELHGDLIRPRKRGRRR